MWLVKYLLFFSTAIVSMVGAGTVIAGAIVFMLFNRIIPPALADLLRFKFLDALPRQLVIIGVVVSLSTLIGCCGAILEGNVGKWLLITYTTELTIFVAINIFVVVALHRGHQKTGSSGAEASALTMVPNAVIDTTWTNGTFNGEITDHLSEPFDVRTVLLRQRRSLRSRIKDAKDSIVGAVHTAAGGVQTVADVATGAYNLAGNIKDLVLSMFKPLSKEEEDAVKAIKPIFGMYTAPVFRLSSTRAVKAAWVGTIAVEIIFILLNIYLCMAKNKPSVVGYYN